MARRARRRRRRTSEPRTPQEVDPIPRPRRKPPGLGQESVWDYPRPPAVEDTEAHVQVWFAGELIAESRHAVRVLETSHPPVFYVPLEDCKQEFLESVPRKRTVCEHKGRAQYYDVVVGDQRASEAGWRYARPRGHYAALKDCIAFYPERVDECRVDGEKVLPQAGSFYGGWVTRSLIGPFKGTPGSEGW